MARLAVTVQVEDPAWRKLWPRAAGDVRALVSRATAFLGTTAPHPLRLRRNDFPLKGGSAAEVTGSVAVVLSDDAHLRQLNFQFRGKDAPTNVLSFPDPDDPYGGMALARETVVLEAKGQGKLFVNHAKHMILHGFLHLLRFDHETPRQARLMEGLEIAILSDMGIPNPYSIEAKRRA